MRKAPWNSLEASEIKEKEDKIDRETREVYILSNTISNKYITFADLAYFLNIISNFMGYSLGTTGLLYFICFAQVFKYILAIKLKIWKRYFS